MKINIQGQPSFGYATIELDPGEKIITESGAMATMSPALELQAKLNGGFIPGLLRKFLGGESLFINHFINGSRDIQSMTLTQPTPGTMVLKELNNETLYLQPTAFIACEESVNLGLKFAGIPSFLAREGLFKVKVSGRGKVIFGAYGQVFERQVKGEMIVDSGHLVAYEPQINLKLQLAGGIVSSVTSGEGVVLRMEGDGKIWVQTRSLGGLARFINRFF
ncbi:MAG: TIGR00266 family protein [Saprospiraceae bacterium]|nr:TIGR00266 family protein [Saprospiraceae bacterium]